MLDTLNTRLLQSNIELHFSEPKTPVKHRLDKARFFDRLGGELFLSLYEAYETLSKYFVMGMS